MHVEEKVISYQCANQIKKVTVKRIWVPKGTKVLSINLPRTQKTLGPKFEISACVLEYQTRTRVLVPRLRLFKTYEW